VASREPLGRADLPTASYTEMMEWALPTTARRRFHALVEELASRPEALPFLRGGVWRNFFCKYSESNLMHKKMLHVSEKLKNLAQNGRRGEKFAMERAEAANLLLRAQCNDAYWHGIFGGLYSPHLRTAVWRPLVQAEAIADRLEHRKRDYADVVFFDFDADGRDEVYFTSEKYAALVAPDDGGTVSVLDFRPSGATLINSLKRRPEAYHSALKSLGKGDAGEVQSIHDQRRTKEEGLERWLQYDRWPRHCFRLLVFGQNKTYEDCSLIQLGEDAALAGGKYQAKNISDRGVTLEACESAGWPARKVLTFHSTEKGFDVECELAVRRNAPEAASVNIGVEVVINFLAPSAPDRYFQSDGKRFPLRMAATAPAVDLSVVDEWQQVRAKIRSSRRSRVLDSSYRDGFRIGGRVRADLSRFTGGCRLAGGACGRSRMEGANGASLRAFVKIRIAPVAKKGGLPVVWPQPDSHSCYESGNGTCKNSSGKQPEKIEKRHGGLDGRFEGVARNSGMPLVQDAGEADGR
jgi:hypothetical protein